MSAKNRKKVITDSYLYKELDFSQQQNIEKLQQVVRFFQHQHHLVKQVDKLGISVEYLGSDTATAASIPTIFHMFLISNGLVQSLLLEQIQKKKHV